MPWIVEITFPGEPTFTVERDSRRDAHSTRRNALDCGAQTATVAFTKAPPSTPARPMTLRQCLALKPYCAPATVRKTTHPELPFRADCSQCGSLGDFRREADAHRVTASHSCNDRKAPLAVLHAAHAALCEHLNHARNAWASAHNAIVLTHDTTAARGLAPLLDEISTGITRAANQCNSLAHYVTLLDLYRRSHRDPPGPPWALQRRTKAKANAKTAPRRRSRRAARRRLPGPRP